MQESNASCPHPRRWPQREYNFIITATASANEPSSAVGADHQHGLQPYFYACILTPEMKRLLPRQGLDCPVQQTWPRPVGCQARHARTSWQGARGYSAVPGMGARCGGSRQLVERERCTPVGKGSGRSRRRAARFHNRMAGV